MSQDASKITLAEKIRRMLAREFDTLAPDVIAGVLANLASELVMLSEAGMSSMSEIQDADWNRPARPLSITVNADHSVEVEATSSGDVHDIMNQVLNVGAVMLKISPAPPLNATVNVRFSFPEYHLNLASSGRVVYAADKGTAIELAQLGKEDRAAIEAVWPDVVSKISMSPDTPKVPAASNQPDAARTSLGKPMRASESVPIPGIGPKTQQTFRRRIDLTDPDIKVISSTHLGLKALETREFYGPEIHSIVPTQEADRIERLADDRIVDILLQLSQSNHTGMLEIRAQDQGVTRQVLFDGGFVVEISRQPRRTDEELGLMLLRADRITKQQLAMAAAHADELNCSLERSLLDLGILDPDRIRHAIAGRLTFLIRELISAKSGDVHVYNANALPTGFLPAPPLRVHVATERVIFRKLFEHYKQVPLKDREAHMQGYLDAYPEIVPDEQERADRTLTEPDHVTLADNVITGRKRLREVFTESTLPHAETYSVIHTLHRMGLLRFDRSLHQTIVRERFRENVTVKFLSVHKASYFEVLNVHWSSYDEVIQKAYDELIVQFDPATVPEHLEAEVHQRVTEIRERVESAYQVLRTREPRHAYRKRIMPEYKLAHAIPLFLKQSELAERRRNWVEALDAVKRVIEIEPGHRDATFRSQRLLDIIENRLSPDAMDSNF